MPARPAHTAAEFVPDTRDLAALAEAAHGCKGCDLYLDATQVVFGGGSSSADMMLVGEQPGDQEDKAGEPFVGPAGKLLDKALVQAGIDRERVYVTNAVKHFKFTLPERGKRRIHKTPGRTEVVACRPWLLAELDAIRPEVLVLMGATAAQSLLGSKFRLTAHRGRCGATSTRSWSWPSIRHYSWRFKRISLDMGIQAQRSWPARLSERPRISTS
ncbi:UdgX family uracil-DNA binding protein [Mycolicibacterium novocastrense]|uniref:Type-4 uracil-DNA glycosylase n=1 Tax=Mycolicibacterium novocastrense TaxID=59813 RepID=A0ABQ0KTD5_MYCNV|nr:UdgX family uracil-DNA binding protein [Mycolicibacterium novocastrense]GAT12869.1 uracil-DNA glycosylase [Mycolicibacterium novocastrense]